MADMMMTAGVDAARDLELQFADIVLPFEVGKAPADRLRDRDRAGVGERAIIEPRTGDDVADQAGVWRPQPARVEGAPELEEIALANVREHQILFVADPDFAKAVGFGEIRDGIHLRRRRIPRNPALGLQGYRHDGVAGRLVGGHIVARPGGENRVIAAPRRVRGIHRIQGFVRRRRQIGVDAIDLLGRKIEHAVLDVRPFRLDQLGEPFGAEIVD